MSQKLMKIFLNFNPDLCGVGGLNKAVKGRSRNVWPEWSKFVSDSILIQCRSTFLQTFGQDGWRWKFQEEKSWHKIQRPFRTGGEKQLSKQGKLRYVHLVSIFWNYLTGSNLYLSIYTHMLVMYVLKNTQFVILLLLRPSL